MRGRAFVLAAGMMLAAGAAAADHRQITMMSVHSEAQIAASPAAVWTYITTGKNFATWCPNWKAARNARIEITKAGDLLDYMDEWGNGGRSVVTYAVRNRELRVAHEPNKGDYVCQAKFLLTPASGGTRLEFWDQYTDENPDSTARDATVGKMQSASDQSLAAIKQGVEKPAPTAAQAPDKK